HLELCTLLSSLSATVFNRPMNRVSPRKNDDFGEQQPTDTPKIGCFVYLLCFMAVIGGFLFGYDTAVVSGAMLYIPQAPGLKPLGNLWKQLIVSITPGMAALGALVAAPSSDKFGRKKVVIASSFVFTVGGVVCAAAQERIMLFIGRILLGLAIGFASTIVPVYVGEASPVHIRGYLLTAFQLMICFGEMASSLVGAGFSYIDPENVGWRLMFAFAAIPSLIQFIGFFFLPESPRFLFQSGRTDNCKLVLERIYNGEEQWINYELGEISRVCEEERTSKQVVGDSLVIYRILRTQHVRRALIIGCALQLFQQLCGVNAIMYYTGTIIKMAGVEDDHTTIWLSSVVGGVFFLSTFVPMALIERIGRRPLLLISVAGVAVSLVLIGVSFLLVNRDSMPTFMQHVADTPVQHFDLCKSYSNCDYCVTDERCGFCFSDNAGNFSMCLPTDVNDISFSVVGPCSAASNMNGTLTFNSEYCKTSYTVMPIIFMAVYIAFFAIGFAPLAWALNAEFYPLWARSTGCALSTFTNWIFSLVISLTFLSLGQAITKYGVFFLYAGITVVAFFFVFFFIPETTGIGIEEVEMLFMSKQKRRKTLDSRRATVTDSKFRKQNGTYE
uniref:Major facilitator superfamily (MFS) profile domain-containing protein n=2 Tax=Parascaris univalens TaxID=6257 RepID=A0A915ATJ5_PARUN